MYTVLFHLQITTITTLTIVITPFAPSVDMVLYLSPKEEISRLQ